MGNQFAVAWVLLMLLIFQQAAAENTALNQKKLNKQVKVVAKGELYSANHNGKAISVFKHRDSLSKAYGSLADIDIDFIQNDLLVVRMQMMGGSPMAYISSGEARSDQAGKGHYLTIPIIYHYYSNLTSKDAGCAVNDVINFPYIAVQVPKSGYQLIRVEEQKQVVDCNQ